MGNSNTPKPTHLALVPRVRSPRRDETVSFETEGPPTVRMEIPITGAPSKPDNEETLLLALPEKRFARGEIIVSEEKISKIFYFIESGRASESVLTSRGLPEADERSLNATDIIGLSQCSRVVAKTDVTVRVIDFASIEHEHNPMLTRFANQLVREAAISYGSQSRDRLVRATEELGELRKEMTALDGIRSTLARIKQQNSDHRENGRLLSHEILRQREVIKHLELTLSHRVAELESALSITGMYKDDYLELTKAIASYGHLFEDMQNSEDPLVATTGFKLLSFLHTLRITTGIQL
jgi:CRP-like cAMP-binding protein